VTGGLGDRFRYLRGASGRRYLFTGIATEELADFRSAVVLLARREPRGLRAVTVGLLDANGSPSATDRWPATLPRDAVVLVHLLADREADRAAIVADLTTASRALNG
jgi:hypothetical protein